MLESIIGIVGSILTIAVLVGKWLSNRKKKNLLEKIQDKKREVDLYIANGRYDQAAHVASDALDTIDLVLRKRGKTSSGGSNGH